jgi:hypothetical protein
MGLELVLRLNIINNQDTKIMCNSSAVKWSGVSYSHFLSRATGRMRTGFSPRFQMP